MSYPQRSYEQQGAPRDYYQQPQSQEYRRDARPQYDSRREFDPRDQRDQRGPPRDYGREVRYDDRRVGGAAPPTPMYDEREREFKRGRYDDYDQNRGYNEPRREEPRREMPPPRRDDYPPRTSGQYSPPPRSYEQQSNYDSPSYRPQFSQQSLYQPPAPHIPHQQYQSRRQSGGNQPVSPPHQQQRNRQDSNSRDSRDEFTRATPSRPEAPSASVVFLGLPLHVDDAGLRVFLEDIGASVDETTIIYDRATNLSKRYGFAKFSSVEHARAFLEPNFPSVTWREPPGRGHDADNGIKININFSQKSGGWREDHGAGARVSEDSRMATSGTHRAPEPFYVNDGTRDIGASPTNTLLLRGLDTLTTEEDIIASLSVGTGEGAAGAEKVRQGGIKSVMITKDRASRSSWGYAFVHFSDMKLATEILVNAFNSNLYKDGFKIRSSTVSFSFCHQNSFVAVYAPSEFSYRGEGGPELTYWDAKAFVKPYIPIAPRSVPVDPRRAPNPQSGGVADADIDAFLSSFSEESSSGQAVNPAVSTLSKPSPSITKLIPPPPYISAPIAASLPVPSASFVAPPNFSASNSVLSTDAPAPALPLPITPSVQAVAETLTAQITQLAPIPAFQQKESPIEKAFEKPVVPIVETKKQLERSKKAAIALGDKQKGDGLIQTKKNAVNITKWSAKQVELAAPLVAAPDAPVLAVDQSITSTEAPTTTEESVDEYPYGDPIALTCLLCQRKFPKIDGLDRHINQSQLHKDNLLNPNCITEAIRQKAVSKGTPIVPEVVSQYVDRAQERRELNGIQPDHPGTGGKKKKGKKGAAAVVVSTEPAPIESSNVGSKMLQNMGWNAGNGLGQSGNGITAPIQATSLTSKAGLGASKGIAVGQPLEYADKVRASAVARYQNEK